MEGNRPPLFYLNFGSGGHFAGLDDEDDKEVLLMKVLLIIEVVLEDERFCSDIAFPQVQTFYCCVYDQATLGPIIHRWHYRQSVSPMKSQI